MRFGRAVLAAFAFVASACGDQGCGSKAESARGATTGASSSSGDSEGSHDNETFDPEAVHVRSEIVQGSGAAVVVENHGSQPIRLSSKLAVERRNGGRWRSEDVGALSLRMSCDETAVDCITLVPGAELRPPPWPARTGAFQCRPCPTCTPLPAGSFRFVVTSCGGDDSVRSDTFELSRTN